MSQQPANGAFQGATSGQHKANTSGGPSVGLSGGNGSFHASFTMPAQNNTLNGNNGSLLNVV